LEQQLPQNQIITIYEEKVREENELSLALEKEKITSDSLSNMCENRKVYFDKNWHLFIGDFF